MCVMRESRCITPGVVVVTAALAGCTSGGGAAQAPPLAQPTRVDCVAVLGGMRPNPEVPLASVPLSGVPQDKLIADLTDDEMNRFCDYLTCITQNGYGHGSVETGPKFHPRSPAVLTGGISVYPYAYDAGEDLLGQQTRAECADFTRRTWGSCHAGVWEEWVREAQWVPTQALPWVMHGMAYRTMVQECGF
jgi:hypothetical protein